MSKDTSTLLPLNPMHLPEPPSWFPLAWGWWTLIASVIVGLLIVWLLLYRKKRHLAAKKTAQRLMASHQKPADAIELVRQAALCYFPREEIAQLTGKEWYEFLDSQLNQPVFIANYELWQQALYSKHPIQETHTLLQDCSLWIDQALPPKRKRRSARG
ncbi:DUF4381 domain-containing protein [Vibrio caribbeanicus]|uniref:DUF4381 domain-containing protein n=1 Tax=Vibrio caribbeanicus TaxID=701175 RepID=UPI0030DC4941